MKTCKLAAKSYIQNFEENYNGYAARCRNKNCVKFHQFTFPKKL